MTPTEKILVDHVSSLIDEVHNLRIDNASMKHRLSAFDDVLFILGRRRQGGLEMGPNPVEQAIKALEEIRARDSQSKEKQTKLRDVGEFTDELLKVWGFTSDYSDSDTSKWIHPDMPSYYLIRLEGKSAYEPHVKFYISSSPEIIFGADTIKSFKENFYKRFANIKLS